MNYKPHGREKNIDKYSRVPSSFTNIANSIMDISLLIENTLTIHNNLFFAYSLKFGGPSRHFLQAKILILLGRFIFHILFQKDFNLASLCYIFLSLNNLYAFFIMKISFPS